jgi:hypothetical protein
MAGAIVLAGAALLAGAAGASETDGRWLHVRVKDKGDHAESVKVNLPISVLETMASSIEAESMKDGRVQFADNDLSSDQIRSMWQAVRSSQDMEFVTVESGDETIRVAKSGGYLLAKIRGNENGHKSGESVDIKVPLDVVDALLSAPKGELNVKAALQILASKDAGAIVEVHDDDTDVRIWIDSRANAE